MSTKLRYFEYYQMQETFDWLYKRSLENRTKGLNLYELITSEKNILLAYRMIKKNTGSKTAGVDNQTIQDYKIKNTDIFIKELRKTLQEYQPNAVKRVEILKENGKTRPLGIPTMRDRLIQQMFKQVLEPICEAQFYKHSYGFRPNRSTKHAFSRSSFLINSLKCTYVVDVDIKGFFDNVNHRRLLKQMYSIGIKDKRVLKIVGKMIKAPIMGEGVPTKGTPQGGILSPLLSNIVLNDLDWWIENQWMGISTKKKYKDSHYKRKVLRKTNLKEMYIVRYADDFKIFTKSYNEAERIFWAVKSYLKKRLKLTISEEKSKITNLKKECSEFLGFEFKAIHKRKRIVARSSIARNRKERIKRRIKELVKEIQKNPIASKVNNYNSFILGIQNYYKCATQVNKDFHEISYSVLYLLYNRLKICGTYEIPKQTSEVYKRFYKNNYRTFKVARKHLFPIADIHWELQMNFNPKLCLYTEKGRDNIYKQLPVSVGKELRRILIKSSKVESLEYFDNRISRYSLQNGRCAVTGTFLESNDAHCHHVRPKNLGGEDNFQNIVIVHEWVHKLIHATGRKTIKEYLRMLQLDKKQVDKLNKYRRASNLFEIEIDK